MSGCLRKTISEKIAQVTHFSNVYHELQVPLKKIQKAGEKPVLHWTPPTDATEVDFPKVVSELKFDKSIIQNVRFVPAMDKISARFEFEVEPQAFVTSLLQPDPEPTPSTEPQPHMVFEFSSPNIAKPFHVGHLRSTIIGNMLANLHAHFGHKVTRLNYLGDWGTQFGMLQVGVEMEGVTDAQLRRDPIDTLYQAYVAANTAAKTDGSVIEMARNYFQLLESGENKNLLDQWQLYRKYTMRDLRRMYERLGVHFDQYDWESQYSQQEIISIITELNNKSLLLNEKDGRKVVQVGKRRVPIIKSDGSTLYLARDIAALVDRFQRYKFERIFYVVDNAQTDHFQACFHTTTALRDDIPLERLHHVKFGRVHGMSTRFGNTVFLRDVLDEACSRMLAKQLESETTKVKVSQGRATGTTADILGISAVLVNDLKQRRQRDYHFDWDKALLMNGDTGIKLQYTHCRLHSLLEKMSHIPVEDIQPEAVYLNEREAQELLFEIARFEQAVWLAKEQLEPCVLVNYLFSLCNSTSRALKRLNVQNETCLEKQKNRILLFTAAKNTLNKGMQILGLSPLNQM